MLVDVLLSVFKSVPSTAASYQRKVPVDPVDADEIVAQRFVDRRDLGIGGGPEMRMQAFQLLAGGVKMSKKPVLALLFAAQQIILEVVDHAMEANQAHQPLAMTCRIAEMAIRFNPLRGSIHRIDLIRPEKQQREQGRKKGENYPKILMKIVQHENNPIIENLY